MGSLVRVVESCLVTPSEKTPQKMLWLSALDNLLVHRGHTPTVYFYRSTSATSDFFDVARLKESMSRTLVPFYPLAGRLGVDPDDQLVINCNAEGALLVVARSEMTIDCFSDLRPSPELTRLFVPHVQPSSIMLGIQVTFLKCGGVALGAAWHHVAGDAISAFHFFQTWSVLTRDGEGAVVDPPCHDRTLVRARSPPVVHPDALSVFCCPKHNVTQPSGPVIDKVFTISKDHLATLKRVCGPVSTFCAVSALVWQCVCIARRLPPSAETHVNIPANIRRGMKPPLPRHYMGNALIFLRAVGVVQDINTETPALTANRIRDAIRRMDNEVVQSAIDYFDLADKGGLLAPSGLPETEISMVSWLGMPVYDANYGWGKPEMFCRAESGQSGLVYLMNDGADGIRMVVCLRAAILEEFERVLYAKLEPDQT